MFDLLLLFFPLSSVFGYEFSALNSIVIVVLTGVFTIHLYRNAVPDNLISNRLTITSSILLSIPLIIGSLISIFGLSCSFTDGLLFYIFITIPAAVIGCSLGLISFSISKKFGYVVFSILFLLIALIPAAEIYIFPQVYFYNPFIGFFPGTIYDEALSINSSIILYRFINLFYFGIVFILLKKFHSRKINFSKWIIISSSALSAVIFLIASPYLGFSTSDSTLQTELSGYIETEHFKIHYSEKIEEKLIYAAIVHHEYYYNELSGFFNIKPKEKITSYIFSSSHQKGKLFGAENADVAKPWLNQIYTNINNYSLTLKHEIAHVFTREFGTGIFKIADGFNPALIEGIASAADPVYDENRIEYLAAVAYQNGYKASIQNLFGYVNFFSGASTLSYIYSGAFVKFLIDNYGIVKFKKLYSNLDFENAYKKSLPELEKEFYSIIKSIPASGKEHTAHYYFGRKSIFQKVCPRYVADRMKEAAELFSNNLFEESAGIFSDLYKVSASYSPLIGWINSLEKINELNKADSILTSEIEGFKNSAYYYNLELKLADLSALQNNSARAESLYSTLIIQNPERRLFYLSNLRKNLLSNPARLKIYLSGNEFNKYIILRELNKTSYDYYSFPVLADLSCVLKEDFDLFLKQFSHTIIVRDYSEAYAVYSLSKFFAENLDFNRASKMAALALRYRNIDQNFTYILESNFKKMEWFRLNAEKILNKISNAE